MYQWVSSDVWLSLGVISLMLYVTKGINYKESITSKRNRIFCWAIGISIFQIALSVIETFNIFINCYKYIFNTFMVYGFLFVCYILIGGKWTIVDKVSLIIFIIGALIICYIKIFLQ